MSYRPICDVWILGRPKVKYYGAYPCGFLIRARDLLGVHPTDPVLHVCSGMVRDYSKPENGVKPGVPVAGFGPNDMTLDIDPETQPDFLQDAREAFPEPACWHCGNRQPVKVTGPVRLCSECLADRTKREFWPAILIDRPYTLEDAAKYRCGADVFPSASVLVKNALAAVRPGGRVGMLDYLFPRPPKDARLVAKVSVNHGYANRDRCYTVFEKPLG